MAALGLAACGGNGSSGDDTAPAATPDPSVPTEDVLSGDGEFEVHQAEPYEPETAWEAVVAGIEPDGTVPLETALQAFASHFGPIPGVEVPDGEPGTEGSATSALWWVAQHEDELTDAQREAIEAALAPVGPDGKRRSRRTTSPAPDRNGARPRPRRRRARLPAACGTRCSSRARRAPRARSCTTARSAARRPSTSRRTSRAPRSTATSSTPSSARSSARWASRCRSRSTSPSAWRRKAARRWRGRRRSRPTARRIRRRRARSSCSTTASTVGARTTSGRRSPTSWCTASRPAGCRRTSR